jgi:hypothetical protein
MAWVRIRNTVLISITSILRVILFARAIYDISRKQFDEKFVRDLILPLNIAEASFLLTSIDQQVLLKNMGVIIAHHANSFLLYYFLLWSLGTPYFMDSDYFHFNSAVTSYLVLSTSKTFYHELAHDKPEDESGNKDELNRERNNTEGGSNSVVTSSRSRFDIFEILLNIAPRPSFALCFLFCSSSLYLLDWEEQWQIWPFLTVCGGFVGSVLDDCIHELSKY